MPQPHSRHLPNMMVLFCIGASRLGLAEALQHYGTHVVVSGITGLEGQR